MIDSVLKGTGNSRFLKSAVPAGTSWADALAMLQAGTFPIDFNGINTEGFQQVGTPLNKANLLKDATAAQIGLPPSTTPDGMFRALGNTGELHVWRKTVVSASEKPAGYTLGAETTKTLGLTRNSNSSSWAITVELASSVSVDDAGNVTLVSPSKLSVYAYNAFVDSFSGKFFRLYSIGSSVTESELANNDVYFVPSGNKLILRADASSSKFYLDLGMKLVTGYAKVPAGTTTTYPVSTNPNAYQEGEYGKDGYTLGDVKTGTFQIGQGATTIAANRAIIKYGASVSVTDTGTESIASESELTVTSDSSQSAVDKLKGKFFRFSQLPFSSSAFSVGKIYFFPANTVFTKQSSGNWSASKYQTVTSHGKTEPEYTIEYLGKLGDKAMVQVVSYVGTGTYGKNNPCSVTFPFKPKVAIMAGFVYSSGDTDKLGEYNTYVVFNSLKTTYKNYAGFCYYQFISSSYAKISDDGKTLTWYTSSNSAYQQCNDSGATYYILCIG